MATASTASLTGEEIVALCREHTLFEWSIQPKVDPIPVARADGVYFWTPEGGRFLDFNSQLMCTNIGHSHPKVVQAVQQQVATLAYANPFMATEPRARLGAKLAEITPGDMSTFFFTNGGAEAVENAVRIARVVTGRHKILARYRSYHGGTAGAISLTGDPVAGPRSPASPEWCASPTSTSGDARTRSRWTQPWPRSKRSSSTKAGTPSPPSSWRRWWAPTAS
jgi:taurine--2-oxoglutarate transaminase